MILSPKCHSELAGVGIWYCWGKSKAEFRRRINDFIARNLIANTAELLGKDIIPLDRVNCFAHKTRDYLNTHEEMIDIALVGNISQEEALVQA